MKYYFDTEFYDQGPKGIELISLGVVNEKGDTCYVENSDVDLITLSPWLKENVVPYLTRGGGYDSRKALISPHREIGKILNQFIGMDPRPQFWAYFADYDWYLLSRTFGGMLSMPPTFPHLCFDVKQEMMRMGVNSPPVPMRGQAHNALDDAIWTKDVHNYLVAHGGWAG